jgi:RNA polymerase sigma-70 factor (ECF subfamily)
MTAVSTGDRQAFDELTLLVRGRGYRMARNWVGSTEDALELCQDALLKVFKSRDSYDPGQPFLPWFHRILRNTCFSHLRKHRRIRPTSLTLVGTDGEEHEFQIIDPEPSPEASALQAERQALFHAALAELTERDREIIALRHFEDLPYKQIAEELDIPEGTVMSRLFHARRRLREALAPHMEDPSTSDPLKAPEA